MDGNGKMSTMSIKRAIFMDGNGKMSLPSRKTAVFLDEESKISSLAINRLLFLADGPGYLLYLRDLDFSTRFARS